VRIVVEKRFSCIYIEKATYVNQSTGFSSVIISESKDKFLLYYPDKTISFIGTFTSGIGTTTWTGHTQTYHHENIRYVWKNDQYLKPYGIKDIEYLYNKYPSEMIDVTIKMSSTDNKYKKSINNVLKMWFKKVPDLEMILQANKYNI